MHNDEQQNQDKSTCSNTILSSSPNKDDLQTKELPTNESSEPPEIDEFGLPVKKLKRRQAVMSDSDGDEEGSQDSFHDALEAGNEKQAESTNNDADAPETPKLQAQVPHDKDEEIIKEYIKTTAEKATENPTGETVKEFEVPKPTAESTAGLKEVPVQISKESGSKEMPIDSVEPNPSPKNESPQVKSTSRRTKQSFSEWSHQQLAPQQDDENGEEEEVDWQEMPAYGAYDIYDDDGRLVARGDKAIEEDAYCGLGGAGKGYTRVQIDEDAKSATSMDENTSYLFGERGTNVVDEDDAARNPLSQMQATKSLLTEGQRIAYVGVTRLIMYQMVKEVESVLPTKSTKKDLRLTIETMKMWSQKIIMRLYSHMEIDTAEQVMIEQLAGHGLQPSDLTPPLMQNARVKNPMAETISSGRPSLSSPKLGIDHEHSKSSISLATSTTGSDAAPPPYAELDAGDLPEVRTPSQLPTTKNIDIDLRWTILCDLFLVLIADSVYDARSRVLLERVGDSMNVSWVDICRFEKRITDALEMQESADKETWDEAEHMENRRKLGLKRKYMMMGLATVGGGLVIGLSAGLLAPVIGAGLAAGFTTIGVAGTSTFLGGVGGAALITSTATVAGGTIAVRASNKRTGAVKTFEYRPLHNNKRVNLIISISGWMNGKADDIRLPFSTVDPIMGDIYSVLWEPEMLQSMGDTINILATEALTQTVQQVLGSTILVALMASLQLPIILTKLSYLIDNPWSVSLDRATAAGLILADSLIDRNLGVRPVTLIGFSLGSRVIFSCLKELVNRGAFGIIQNVYLFGSPVVAKKDEWLRARAAVAGRFVNGYASNDWILGYLFRATSGGIMRVAGLAPVEDVSGLENIDCTEFVNGHMAYRAAMPKLLKYVGWEVESEEFAEIEDPDPENHAARQRELIREIDEARKDAESKPEKKKFGFFKRGKLAEKRGWETYDDRIRDSDGRSSNDSGDPSRNSGVLFDIDAIRAELESEQVEVKQLESTMPPMKLDIDGDARRRAHSPHPHGNLRQTQSYDANIGKRSIANTLKSRPVHKIDEELPPEELEKWTPKNLDLEHGRSQSVQMTFETAFDDPPRKGFAQSSNIAWQDGYGYENSRSRPELRSSITMPDNIVTLEHNAWASDDDNFGQEEEIHMSFE
ncbi:MAG: hypothetical protein M1834_002688 [Cirrosporium novae-zelandiae]|nr:MAG: hypothetical protein M1834_002688 [Cirrosporium novae-zelandiae]